MSQIRLKLAAFGDEENLIIEVVDGVPEVRRERSAIVTRDRSMTARLGDMPEAIITVSVEAL